MMTNRHPENPGQDQCSVEHPKLEDIDAVLRLAMQADEIRTGNEGPNFWGQRTLDQWRLSELGVFVVARLNSEVVGFALASYNPLTRDGYLNVLVVDNRSRRTGIGNELLAAVERQLVSRGCNHIFGMIKPSNAAMLALVAARGYMRGDEFYYCEKHLR